jgi:Ca-activated chloride channel family protein
MKIARIEMLFLIWSLPVLLLFFLYGMRRRQGILKRFASARGLAAIAPARGSGLRWIKAALILASLLWAAVALSGPQYGYRWEEIERKGIDIVVALDCSKSMLARDMSPSRLDRAKREVYDLLGLLRGDRIGLVAFAGTAFLQCPLTLDYGAFHLFLETLTPEYLPIGGSDLTAAVAAAVSAFDAEGSREKAVILITDGEDTGSGDPRAAAADARDAGVKLFCIGVGTGQGIPVPDPGGGFMKDRDGTIVVSRLDEETLREAALATGGTYVRSTTGDMDLDVIYTREIRGGMTMETLDGGRKQVWEDRYQWVLFLAAAALMVELCLPSAARPGARVLLIFLALSTGGPARADALREGASAYDRGEYEAALEHFIDAQLEDPDAPELLYNIGNTYYRMGKFDAAARHFDAAAAGDRRLRQDALFNLGNANVKRKAFEEAVQNYEAVLKMAPDDREALENLAVARRMAQQQQESPQGGSDGPQGPSDAPNEVGGGSGAPEEGPRREEKSAPEPSPGGDASRAPAPPEDGGNEKEAPGGQSPGQRAPGEGDAGAAPGPAPDEVRRGGKPGDPGENGQAARMLNRLKDAPGRALMPGSGKRQVERDW